MIKTDETFDLIKSLTANEKRFFQLFAKLRKGEKNYMRVFSILDKMKTYDAKRIASHFSKTGINVSSEKNYLQKQILKSMRIFHSENNTDFQLNGMLSDIRFLVGKEQFSLCERLTDVAKNIAQKNELHFQLIRVLDVKYEQEGNAVRENAEQSKTNKLSIVAEIRKALEAIETNLQYELLYAECVSKMREKVRVRNTNDANHFSEIINNPLLLRGNLDKHPAFVQFMVNSIFGLYYISNNQFKKAILYQRKNLILMQKMSEALRVSPRLFYNNTNNYMYACLFAEKYDELKLFMHNYREGHYKNLPIDFSVIENVMEESLLNYTLALSIQSKDYALGLSAISNYEKKIEEYKKIINPEMLIAIYYKMARICFSANKLKDALRWINRIINTTRPDVRPDAQSYTRILNLIVHLELGNADLLESAIVSTERFLKKNEMLYKIEITFLDFMKDFLKTTKEKEKQNLFHALKIKLLALKKDPIESNAFLHFDYLEWVNEKLN